MISLAVHTKNTWDKSIFIPNTSSLNSLFYTGSNIFKKDIWSYTLSISSNKITGFIDLHSIIESTRGLCFIFFWSATKVANFVKEITENFLFKAFAILMAKAVFPVPGSPAKRRIYPAASIFTFDSTYSY